MAQMVRNGSVARVLDLNSLGERGFPEGRDKGMAATKETAEVVLTR